MVAQLALTLVFLVGAGLFLRTINALREVPLGFSEQNVLTGGVILNGAVNLSNGQAGQVDLVRTMYLPLLDRLRAIPGVRQAALSSVLPMRSEFAVMTARRTRPQRTASRPGRQRRRPPGLGRHG